MRSIFTAALFVALVAAHQPSEAAQRRGGRGEMMPRYDTATEVTLRGIVQEVKEVTEDVGRGRGRGMGGSGTHVIVKTADETVEVHLGPSAFLAEQKLVLENGDDIEVVGSRVTTGGADAVLAREVRKGDQTVTLRDAQGLPKWSGGPGR